MSVLLQYTLYFSNGPSGQGWRENVVLSVPSSSTVTALDDAVAWANKRRKYLAQDNYVDGWSRRRIDNIRATKVMRFGSPLPGQVVANDNEPGDCLDYRFTSADFVSARTYQMRGIPDDWIEAAALTPLGLFNANNALTDYFAFLQSGGYLSLRQAYTPASYTNITSMTPVYNAAIPPVQTAVNVFVQAAQAWVVNQKTIIQIKNIKGYPYLSGRWTGFPLTTTSISVPGMGRYAPPPSGNGGALSVISVNPNSVGSIDFDGLSYRKCGKPFFLRPGKRSAKVLHRPS